MSLDRAYAELVLADERLKDAKTRFACALWQAREGRRMTLDQAREKTRLSAQYLSDIERHAKPVTIEAARKILFGMEDDERE